MEGRDRPMVSYSSGSMNSLLDKLTKLENRPKKIKELQEDLVALKEGFFDKFAGRGEMDAQVRVWMEQVKELVSDIEDWIDQKPETNTGESERKKKIEEFETLIKEARDLCTRYELLKKAPTDCDDPAVLPGKATIDSRLLFEEKTGLVAVHNPTSELVKHLTDEQPKMLKVVSVVGREGLGKTTLAKEIYAKLEGQFDCQAFVTVGRRPSMRATLMDILRQVKLATSSNKKTNPRDGRTTQDLQKVITELWEYLSTKRYFILVDGLWSTGAWKVINCALPDKNYGSRVLTTTCISDVVKCCSIHPSNVVYRMKALSENNFRSLFLQSIREVERPADFDDVSAKILKICDGMPLAVIITAGLFAWKSAKLGEPKMLGKSILSSLEQYSASEGMTKILHMSYADLSVPLKSCFLYLSVFPENYTIKKDRLLRLWGAEGFIPRRDEESLWETGESFFNELVSRRLIQPVFDYKDDQAVACTVHCVILDFIRSLSSNGNFITVGADLSSGLFPCSTNTIRRFSLDCYGDEDEDGILSSSTVHLSKVRSLTVLGDIERLAGRSALTVSGDLEGTSVLPSFKLMRVLDLEDTDNLRSHHLEGIEGLVLLRYLGLGGTAIDKLPGIIGELEQLETLDLRQTKLSTLPASILRLKRLVCLLLDDAVELPRDIWELQGLEEVSTIGANSSSSLDLVSELIRKSEQLRVLGVRLDGLHQSDDKSVRSFLEEVARSTKLMSLSLGCLHFDLVGLLLEVRQFQLRRFELTISGPILGGDVRKLAYFVSLTHLDIEIIEVGDEGVRVLGDLPNLVLFKLVSSAIRSSFRKISESRCIIGEDGFRSLKVFRFTCIDGGTQLEFTLGAMRKLRRLWLSFIAQETLSLYKNFDFGIEHLSCLAQVRATINCKSATALVVKDAEAAIREQVGKCSTEPTTEFKRTNQHMMLRDKGKKTTSTKTGVKKIKTTTSIKNGFKRIFLLEKKAS